MQYGDSKTFLCTYTMLTMLPICVVMSNADLF